MNNSNSPFNAALDWAVKHPDQSAKIKVIWKASSAPVNSSQTETLIFYASGGEVAASHANSMIHSWNGVCDLCRKVFLKPVLQKAWVPEPEAGKEKKCRDVGCFMEGAPNHRKHIMAPEAYVSACNKCVFIRELDTNYSKYPPFNSNFEVRKHPAVRDIEKATSLQQIVLDLIPKFFQPEEFKEEKIKSFSLLNL